MKQNTKEKIIAKFGGTGVVAEICNVSPGAVSQWTIIPARHQMTLLQEARARGIVTVNSVRQTSCPRNRSHTASIA